MATDKELKTLLLLCEKDPDYFNSIVQMDKIELKHYCKELIQYGGTTIALAGGNNFTDDKLVKPARKTLKLFKHKQQSIVINHAFKGVLYNTLKSYFSPEDHSKLNNLLQGEKISGRVLFLKEENQLAYIFKQVIEKGEISSSRKEVSNWLGNWFLFTDTNNKPANCSYNESVTVISDPENKHIPSNPIIV